MVLAGQPVGHGAGVVHALDGVGLGDVEDGQQRVSDDGSGLVFAGGVVGLGDGLGRSAEDPQRAFALADLAALGLPGPVAGDVAGVRALPEDQQQVVQAVAVERGDEVQVAAPLLAGAQRLDLVGDAVVQGVGLGGQVSRPRVCGVDVVVVDVGVVIGGALISLLVNGSG